MSVIGTYKAVPFPKLRDVMTAMFDHDVVDGAPAALFIARLTELVESAFGLIEESD